MVVDIRPALSGQPRHFSGRADLSGLRLWGEALFPQPAELKGTLTLRHGQVWAEYTVSYDLSASCARCLTEIQQSGQHSFSHPVRESQVGCEQDEEVVCAPGGMLDVTALCAADLLLEFASPLLCTPDCKGLCPDCGTDLNPEQCACADKEKVDPRFAALLEFIE